MGTKARTAEQKARRRAVDHAYAERRAAEINKLIKELPPVECACGCGTMIPALTKNGTPRRYADRHGCRAVKITVADRVLEKLVSPIFEEKPACADEDPNVFFDDTLTGLARAVCGRCPVQEQCLAWALSHGEREGVWGGLTPRQRAARPDYKVAPPALTVEERRQAIRYYTRRGESAERIADRLGLSARTVIRHRGRLKEAA